MSEGKPYPPEDPASVRIFTDTAELLRHLKDQGYLLIVVTNQPDVPTGKVTRETVEEVNQWLGANLPLDDVFTCYHDDIDNCRSRTPRPGMLLEASRRYDIDLPRSYIIGDRWRDIRRGQPCGPQNDPD